MVKLRFTSSLCLIILFSISLQVFSSNIENQSKATSTEIIETENKFEKSTSSAIDNEKDSLENFMDKHLITIIVALLSFFGSFIIAKYTARWQTNSQLKKAKQEFKQSSAKEIIEKEDISNARKKIKFLIDARLIEDFDNNIIKSLGELNYENESIEDFLESLINFDEINENLNTDDDSKTKENIHSLGKLVTNLTSTINLNLSNHLAYRLRALTFQKLAHVLKGDETIYFFERSFEDLSYAIKLKSDSPHYYYLRGLNYINLNNIEKALKDIKKSNELTNYQNPEYLFYEGIFLGKSHDFDQSVKLMEKAIHNTQNPKFFNIMKDELGKLLKYPIARKEIYSSIIQKLDETIIKINNQENVS